jgi:hypothetical protein
MPRHIIDTRAGICVHSTGLYIITEFVSGGDVRKLLKVNPSLSWKKKVRISVDLAKAMLFLHSKKIIHRDLKSKSILILLISRNMHNPRNTTLVYLFIVSTSFYCLHTIPLDPSTILPRHMLHFYSGTTFIIHLLEPLTLLTSTTLAVLVLHAILLIDTPHISCWTSMEKYVCAILVSQE